ncbi:MAG: leucine-rich repeat domain-containing protein [Victivallis vadensis]
MNDVQFKNLLESMQVIFGDGLPLPEQGKDLDLYIDQTHRKFYRKYFGAWNCAADVVLGPLFTTGTMSWDQLLIDPSLGQLMQLRTDAEGNRLIVLLAPAGDRQYVLAVKNGAVFWIDRQQEFLDLLDDQKDIPGGIPGLGDDGKVSDSVLPDDLARLDSPRFTGTPTAPTAGKGTSTDQIATTKFVQNEVADFLSPNQSSFVASQWLLDQASSKYYHRIVTDARDISHVYKNEDGGFMVFDDTVEIHVVEEGYIKLVAAAGFDGHIVTLSKRLPVTYSYTPVTDEAGQIVSLTLTGVVSNPGNITDLDIPSSAEYEGATYPVKKIGESAFNGSRVTSVNIGEGVEEIGYAAFMSTKQLQSITLPSSLRRIGEIAFYLSNLPAVTLPEGLVQIDSAAFKATLLTALHIPASVTAIYGSPAPGCLNLAEITVAPDNPNYSAQDNVLYDKAKETLIQYSTGAKNTSFAVPEGVKTLGRSCFNGAYALTSLILPDSLERINFEALTELRITSLTIPANVQVIEKSALCGLANLSEFSVAEGSQFFTAQDGVLFDKNQSVLVQYPGGNTRTSYTVPDTVTEIASGAFRGIRNLATVTLQEGVQIIRILAFYASYAITGISIPASVVTIEDGAFGFLSKLTEITVAAGNQNYSAQDGALFDKDKTLLTAYPAGNARTEYTLPATVTRIGASSFYGVKLTAVTFPDGLLKIDDNAFNMATALTALAFPASVDNIANTAFYNCAELAEITFHNPGRWTMDNPFPNCPKLFTVWGYPGSTAEDYAKRFNYLFKSLEEA